MTAKRIVGAVRASTIRPEPVTWFHAPYVPLGTTTALVGPTTMGKTTMACETAARATRGQLDGDLKGRPVSVFIATAEDNYKNTVVPRLTAAGADLERVFFLEVVEVGEADLPTGILLPLDVNGVTVQMGAHEGRLLIIDPFVAHLPEKIDSYKDQHVRRALAPLRRLAEELEAAVELVMHFNRSKGPDLLERISGSLGLGNAVRSVLGFVPDPSDPDGSNRVLVHLKCNLGAEGVSLRYRIEGRTIVRDDGCEIATSGIAWLGEAPEVGKADVGDDSEERGAKAEAVEWLRTFLADGSQPARVVTQEAEKAGIRPPLLREVRRRVARTEKTGFGAEGEWVWALREPAKEAGPSTPPHLSHLSDLRPLPAETGPTGPLAAERQNRTSRPKEPKAPKGRKAVEEETPPEPAEDDPEVRSPTERAAERLAVAEGVHEVYGRVLGESGEPGSLAEIKVSFNATEEPEPLSGPEANEYVRAWNRAAYEAGRDEVEKLKAHTRGRRDRPAGGSPPGPDDDPAPYSAAEGG